MLCVYTKIQKSSVCTNSVYSPVCFSFRIVNNNIVVRHVYVSFVTAVSRREQNVNIRLIDIFLLCISATVIVPEN